jgi:hypothetical protein
VLWTVHATLFNATNAKNINFPHLRHKGMQGGVEVLLQSFLIPVLDGGKQSLPRTDHSTLGTLGRSGRFCALSALSQGKKTDVRSIGGWVGPREVFDGMEENTLQLPVREIQEPSSL